MSDRSPTASPLRLLLVALSAPWWALWLSWWLIRRALRAWRAVRALPFAFADHAPCPACGDRNALLGRWRCRCGFVYLGHAFAPCPSCHAVADWIECGRCGAGIRSPAA